MENSDTLRILVATDNHLGVWESDTVRQNDSFETFDEIFQIAKSNKVDFVLLGGDLFHENKPSRHTIVKATDILTKHCLNYEKVSFEILSDEKIDFTTGRANFKSPHYNIGMPVFTIHGNHDDPSSLDNISAVDILASNNLVNYFGKVLISGTGAGKVRISPILIRKGNTKIALYGLGNVRDERLARLFHSPNGVEWVRPASTEFAKVEDWVNLFILHQNRIPHSQGAKNIVKESHLPKFLDIVIWGHEHECITQPWTSLEAASAFSVLQPGSSVATALSEGESKKKHVFLLEVKNQQWRTIKIPLETVRPFAFDSVVLSKEQDVNPGNPDSVTAFLTSKIDTMIAEAKRCQGAAAPDLPLVRCRVDYTGFSTINTQKFAQKFVKKVANPQDLLLWQKSQSKRMSNGNVAAKSMPHATEETNIEDLVTENLVEQLKILHEKELGDALHDFVQKDEKSALLDTVNRVMKETWTVAERNACQDATKDELQSIAAAISSAAEHRRYKLSAKQVIKEAAKVQAENSALPGEADADPQGPKNFMSAVMQLGTDDRLTNAKTSAPGADQKASNGKPRKRAMEKTTDVEDLTDSPIVVSKSTKRQATKRAKTQNKRRADSETESSWDMSESSVEKDEDEIQIVGKKRATRTSTRSGARPSQFESRATQPSLQKGKAIAGLRAQQRTKSDRSQISKWGALK